MTQAWSFQKAGISDVSTEVKAWGYALGRLRDGESARIVTASEHVSRIDADVDLQVVIASPVTGDQQRVYEEAQQVFGDLHVHVHSLDEADAVARRAAELVRAEHD